MRIGEPPPLSRRFVDRLLLRRSSPGVASAVTSRPRSSEATMASAVARTSFSSTSQAKRFHAALRRADVSAELFFTPRDNHIYEMISMTYDDDVTTRAVLRFLRGVAP